MLNGRSPWLMAPVGEDVEYKQEEVVERGRKERVVVGRVVGGAGKR